MQAPSKRSPWDAALEADKFAHPRTVIANLAHSRDEWAGIPIPIDGEQLVLADGYTFTEPFRKCGLANKQIEDPEAKLRNVRRFWSWKWRRDVIVFDDDNGKRSWCLADEANQITYEVSTVGASYAWSLEAEQKALMKLADLVPAHTWKMYMLTGQFLETSQRSGVTYLFRRLRPTAAIKARGEQMRVLCTLCLHPIGYYSGSWGGAMVPTDDVMAHLLLMRGDEPFFWRKANQHAAYRKESGL